MSPEYALEGLFSIKSDVFAFGVVLLEIISGRRNMEFFEDVNLIGYVGSKVSLINTYVILLKAFIDSKLLITGMETLDERRGIRHDGSNHC